MKKARITPVALATALVAILQTTPAAAGIKTQTVDYKLGWSRRHRAARSTAARMLNPSLTAEP